MDAEITTLSSRGQIVIPQSIREKMKLKDGQKFMVVSEGDAILLKKAQFSFEGFDELLEKTRQWAEKNRITEQDVEEAIRRVRQR